VKIRCNPLGRRFQVPAIVLLGAQWGDEGKEHFAQRGFQT
jgi:hypothetical protein